ncbi:hypothetical protein ABZ260_17190 [Streptosporangium sp. NPDC006013]|uniref:hypothetical protein n=1 Tax=Streptosporangium sp. NPDC006013 TaxID=3155596 RepID=UPI0033BB0726
MTTPTKPPWRPLWDRVAGKTGERELVDDVPDYLLPVIQEWLAGTLDLFDDMATSIQLRLRKVFTTQRDRRGNHFVVVEGSELLGAIDAALFAKSWLVEGHDTSYGVSIGERESRRIWTVQVKELQFRLWEGGSAWQLTENFDGLERRVDETVVKAAQSTITAAPPDASTRLKAAWSAAYGFHPDPEKAYSQAIKAAEAVVIPATIPNAGTPTLGTALKHLEDTAAKWTTVLDDKSGKPASAEPVIGLIKMLWQGQRDRHAGGPTSKPTTQEAAEAAVHAAILIVQWFNSSAVVKNP